MISRRELLKDSMVLGAGMTVLGPSAVRAQSKPSEKMVLGIMGLHIRGKQLANVLATMPNAEIAYLCDPDERQIAIVTDLLVKKGRKAPKGVADFRRILDDKSVDALVVAAPNHWHGPATILGCSAGKHVYVEKPASHNPREGELMIAASRKYNKVVQLGTQRRSMPGVQEAIRKLKSGVIGRPTFARGWYNNTRATIGKGKTAPVPEWLNYDLWQGPAPDRPYKDNLVHYNWHWFWHWGNGELGNNGIHSLDVCRWGLGVDTPIRVTSSGGKYRFPDDDQQTPDTHIATFDFGDCTITWEGRSWHRRGFEDSIFGMAFYGEGGTMIIDGGGYRILDMQGKEMEKKTGSASEVPHFQNFFDCIKNGGRPTADIEEGHKSTMLCHLGNIAWRTGRAINLDPKSGKIRHDREAQMMWSREYRKGWEPKV